MGPEAAATGGQGTGGAMPVADHGPDRYSWRTIRALIALGVGGFAIGSGEFVIMGLLPNIAHGLDVSISDAGMLISAYALGVTIGAPILAVLVAHWPRRNVLLVMAGLYALGNLAVAVMPGYWGVAAARFAVGFPHGPFFGVAALVAATLAPASRRGQAVGFVMLGLSVALLLGAPLGTWLGQTFGWRFGFVFVAALAAVGVVLIRLWVPWLPPIGGTSPLRELGALANPQVWLTLGIIGVGYGGMFCVYSYIKPTLVQVSGLDVSDVPMAMVVFGVGSVLASLFGPRLADHSVTGTIAATMVYSILLLAAFGFLMRTVPTAFTGLFLLGGVMVMGPVMQVRLMDVAGHAQTLAAALNHSAFNFANAMGAGLGALVVASGWAWTSLGWVGVMMSLAGMLIFAVSILYQRRHPLATA